MDAVDFVGLLLFLEKLRASSSVPLRIKEANANQRSQLRPRLLSNQNVLLQGSLFPFPPDRSPSLSVWSLAVPIRIKCRTVQFCEKLRENGRSL